MLHNNLLEYSRFILSSFLMMTLTSIPWSENIQIFTPDWTLLSIIYWGLAAPDRVGIFSALALGLLTDVLTGSLLGQHALSYSLVMFVTLNLHKRLRQFPALQQGLFIFCCLSISQLLIFWINNASSSQAFQLHFWLPLLVGTFCWPPIYFILRIIRLAHFGSSR